MARKKMNNNHVLIKTAKKIYKIKVMIVNKIKAKKRMN